MQARQTIGAIVVATGVAVAAVVEAASFPALDPNDVRVADRKAMRDLLITVERAFNKVDVDAVIGVLEKDAVVVWQDAVRTASHQQVRDHYKRTFEGAGGAILRSMSIKADARCAGAVLRERLCGRVRHDQGKLRAGRRHEGCA